MPLVYEHEVLSTMFDLSARIDRLNFPNLRGLEHAARRLMLIESAVLENPGQPSFEGARHFLGRGNQRGGALVAPSLVAYVAKEVGAEAAIAKEKRKAAEAKAAAQGKAKGAGKPSNSPSKND